MRAVLPRALLASGFVGCCFVFYGLLQDNRGSLRRTEEYCARVAEFCVPVFVSQLEKLRPFVNCDPTIHIYVQPPDGLAFDSFAVGRYALSPCKVYISDAKVEPGRAAVIHISHDQFKFYSRHARMLSGDSHAENANRDEFPVRSGDFLYIP